MNSTWPSGKRASLARWGLFMVAALVLAGCGRDEIHAYTEPKDGAAPPMAHGTAATAAPDETSSAATPEISLKLPAGWTEIASDGVNLRCFQVGNSAGATATAGIARLGHLSGMEAMLVNMWRSQAGEPALPDDQAAKLLLPVDFAGLPGSLYEISGTSTNGPTRILVAFAHRPDGSWFCKLSGNSDLVTAQKPAFLDFVKTLEFKDSAAAPAAMPAAMTAPPVAAGASQFKWTVPPQWQAAAAGDMQAAVYKVTGPDGAKGEVSVSIFPNEAGGTLANINRWRTKFVGLAAVEEKDLPQLVTPLDPSQAGALLVDMKNGKKQLIGAIVPRAGQYWFYKFVGDSAAVTPQKDAFIAFAKSSP